MKIAKELKQQIINEALTEAKECIKRLNGVIAFFEGYFDAMQVKECSQAKISSIVNLEDISYEK